MAAQETNIKYPQHAHMLMWLLCSLCLHRVEALLQAIAQVPGGVVELLSTRHVQPFFIISNFSVGQLRRLTSQQWRRNFDPNLLLATWIQTCCIIWNTMSRRGVSMMWGLSGRGLGVKFSGSLRCFESGWCNRSPASAALALSGRTRGVLASRRARPVFVPLVTCWPGPFWRLCRRGDLRKRPCRGSTHERQHRMCLLSLCWSSRQTPGLKGIVQSDAIRQCDAPVHHAQGLPGKKHGTASFFWRGSEKSRKSDQIFQFKLLRCRANNKKVCSL